MKSLLPEKQAFDVLTLSKLVTQEWIHLLEQNISILSYRPITKPVKMYHILQKTHFHRVIPHFA